MVQPTPPNTTPFAASAAMNHGLPLGTLSPAPGARGTSVKRIAGICAWLLALVIGLVVYGRVTQYGTKVVASHPVDARIEMSNPPAWLDRRIVNSLLEEAYQFAGRDMTTYNRSRDVLDGGILKEIANLYAGTEVANGKASSRQAVGYNAWMKRVIQVRRVVAQGDGMQSIQIFAEWREPAAWVRVRGDREALYYLIDAEGTRLPGEYHAADRGTSPLMVIAGVDVPSVAGRDQVPPPGEKWFAKGSGMGEDLSAALQLLDVLNKQKFANQIAAIDMGNYSGRGDSRAAWIVLETVWPTAGGMPRVVQWGRPIGQEKYYEVQSAAKIKTLKDLQVRFGRIDAGRDYVDIRSDVVRLPKVAAQPQPGAGSRG